MIIYFYFYLFLWLLSTYVRPYVQLQSWFLSPSNFVALMLYIITSPTIATLYIIGQYICLGFLHLVLKSWSKLTPTWSYAYKEAWDHYQPLRTRHEILPFFLGDMFLHVRCLPSTHRNFFSKCFMVLGPPSCVPNMFHFSIISTIVHTHILF